MTSPPQSSPALSEATAQPGGTILASLLASTLGLAVVVPGLLLQGVATRPRASASGDAAADVEPGSASGAPSPTVSEAEDIVAENAQIRQVGGDHSASALADVSEASPIAPGHRPRRGQAKPAVPRAGATSADAAASARPAAGYQPPADQRGRTPNAGSAETEMPDAADVTAVAADPDASGLVALAPDGPAAEGDAREPVAFTEVQAAHAAAARSYRDLRIAVNEAYRIIGRLNVERYEAQLELAELKGLPLPERPPDRSWKSAARPSALPGGRPSAPAGARRLKRNRELDEDEMVPEAEVKAMGRRRQLILIGLVLGVTVSALAYRLLGWSWFPNILDRQALADMAGIGIAMQVFFLIFFLFRLTTLTGKGKSWLFPTAEEESWKRRRKRVRGR